MLDALVLATLLASALLLTLLAPGLLARWQLPRRAPGPALLLWQSVAVAGVLACLLAAPAAALTAGTDHPLLLVCAVLLSTGMAGRLLWSGHRIGTDLRRLRAEHRSTVDAVGERMRDLDASLVHDPVAVLAHPSPTAYCLPGGGDRIVLSRAAVDRLGPEELRAVLAHEQAHLDQRHDLLLELFTVLHQTVPERARAEDALAEAHLLAEALADQRSAARVSPTALARALVSMVTRDATADALATPALSAVAGSGVRTRLALLAAPPAPGWLGPSLVAASAAVLALPVGLVLLLRA